MSAVLCVNTPPDPDWTKLIFATFDHAVVACITATAISERWTQLPPIGVSLRLSEYVNVCGPPLNCQELPCTSPSTNGLPVTGIELETAVAMCLPLASSCDGRHLLVAWL